MEAVVERPPVEEEKKRDRKEGIGTNPIRRIPSEHVVSWSTSLRSAPPIVFESFQASQSQEDASIHKQDDKLEATKTEMVEVREENERLKALLSHIVRDYHSLQMHFLDVVKLQELSKRPATPPVAAAASATFEAGADEAELVSLSLGSSSGGRRRDEKPLTSKASHEGLSLGLSCEYRARGDDEKATQERLPVQNLSSDSSGDEAAKEDEPGEPCLPSKASRNFSGSGGADDEVLQQQGKKARVSVRAKCDTPTMNDGCQWRKYGQKISKGNPCPRAYYRCTVAPACPVRKQVQRCTDDMSILITTYEGTHNHPLPPAAEPIASTTSAAASMYTSGSLSSSSGHHLPLASAAGLLGPTTISSTASCPTITLDLTAPHPLLPSYASACCESRALPAMWSSGFSAYGRQSYYPKNSPFAHLGMSMGMARPEHYEQVYQPYLQTITNAAGGGTTSAATDTIAKAITSDPNFRSALAAAITSYMGCSVAPR